MKVLLVVTGSISCYKSIELVRGLVKSGHQVKVILTRGAQKFLRPELFEYLGCQEVYGHQDDFKRLGASEHGKILHITLARWAERMVFYPLSANTLAKLVGGFCDDLASSCFLARETEKVGAQFFPAMNSAMWDSHQVQKNVQLLKQVPGTQIIEPDTGLMACGEEGSGRVPDWDYALHLIEAAHFGPPQKKILITTGATLSPMDPIRYVTNGATGKTGFELAKTFLAKGHEVFVVATLTSTKDLDKLKKNHRYNLCRIATPSEMAETVLKHLPHYDVYISSAAIGDMEFEPVPAKIKKKDLFTQSLSPIKSTDILAKVLENRRQDQIVVGFAAETDLSEAVLKEKYERKPVDLLVGNSVSNRTSDKEANGFGEGVNSYQFVELGELSTPRNLEKKQMASFVENWIKEKSYANHPNSQ